MSTPTHIRVALTTGDPAGIGPEITRAALLTPPPHTTLIPFGTLETWTPPHTHRADAGHASFDALQQAIHAVKRGDCHALCTAPISKEAWRAARVTPHPGHTELLAEAFNSPDSGMLFVGPSLRVMLATIHVPLSDVPPLITTPRVLRAVRLAHQSCLEQGINAPRIAVCGLNPHAGENGLLGTHDRDHITPAITQARAEGINATGPHPADTLFTPHARSTFDAAVAMYHDQGLIPVKIIDGPLTVNLTVGLRWNNKPVVRTSPAHGTAFDAVGRADPAAMRSAVALAAHLARSSL